MSESTCKYVCSLTKESEKKAKEELGEDPKERLGAVTALREWVEREPWIQAPTDPLFLLSFLRCGKFSQLKARERLTNFIAAIDTVFPFMKGKDPGDEKQLNLLRKSKVYTILPGTDRKSRKVILGRFGAMDTSGKSYSFDEWLGAVMHLLFSLMLFDENFQVNGATFLMDIEGMSLQMMTFWGIDNMKKQTEFTNNAIPMRIKSINYVNTGPVFETIMTVFKPMLSKKLQDRIQVHGNKMSSVYKNIDQSLLPEEYLPDDYDGQCAGSLDEIMEKNIKEYLLEPTRRAYMKKLYSGKYSANLKEKNKSDEPQASFRKLNVS